MEYEKSFSPEKKDVQKLRNLLLKYNNKNFETTVHKNFAFYAKEAGNIIGGITGDIFGQWLEIEYLVVDEQHRGKGVGGKLLRMAEEEAQKNNCKYMFLFTFGFQGKTYYPRFGFKEVFSIRDYPITGTEHWFIKTLN
ncbi:GNAT family N-acetyltransferase [Liquorilactobacillus uvarum]|uniref:GNAT family N-acetyltransferase n=1 Tax=Liquorilactobacillus uvarum TaxID=303240 RepID=UPI002889D094|nr:GNAT family N-acetyltransferase [Liquorilactobacillus uvarum]